MMKSIQHIFLTLLALHSYLYAYSLAQLLEFADSNNQLIEAKSLSIEAKSKEIDSQKGDYYPTLDVGVAYQRLDDRTITIPGVIQSEFAKVSYTIYDGGKRSSLVSQKKSEHLSSTYDKKALQKSIYLRVTQQFFAIKNLQSTLKAYKESQKSLQAQLERIQRFYEAKVATKDEVDKLQSAYDTNIYQIESLKFSILELKKSLELSIGVEIQTLDESHFEEIEIQSMQKSDEVQALMAKKEGIQKSASSLSSVYKPQVRIEDTYSFYQYNETDALHPEGLDKQNKLMLTLSMRLYDNNSIQSKEEAILVSADALSKQVAYKTQEQEMNYELSKHRIATSKLKIKSAKSALISAKSAYRTIEEKYNAGLVDNVAYLDALTMLTQADALYANALNDLESAYAMHYYYSGKNLEEYLK